MESRFETGRRAQRDRFHQLAIKPRRPLHPWLFCWPKSRRSKWFQKKLGLSTRAAVIFWAEGTVVPAGAGAERRPEFSSYWDLLQPKWRGKIVMGARKPAAPARPAVMLFYQRRRRRLYAKFYRETSFVARLPPDDRLAVEGGKSHPFPSTEEALRRCARGRISSFPIEGRRAHVSRSDGVSSVPHLPHRPRFINWILSPTGKAFRKSERLCGWTLAEGPRSGDRAKRASITFAISTDQWIKTARHVAKGASSIEENGP
jgi:hypothetical protein